MVLKKLENQFEKLNYTERISFLKKINPNNINEEERAKYYHFYAKTNYLNNYADEALDFFLKAKDSYKKLKNFNKVIEINIIIAQIKGLSKYKYESYKHLLDEAVVYARKENNIPLLCSTLREIGNGLISKEPKRAIHYYDQAKEEAKKIKDSVLMAKLDISIAVVYGLSMNDIDRARKYNANVLKYLKRTKNTDLMAYIFINEAAFCREEGKLEEAIKNYLITDTLEMKDYKTNFKIQLYGKMSDTYKQLKNFEKAIEYNDKKVELEKIINEQEEAKAIHELNTKYETKEKELENQALKIKDEKNKLVIYGFIGIFLIFLTGAYFRISYINRKKKIAEQERLLESQKLENVLKEQELLEIDKLLEGQEKERLKIANDLHDNLGSILATLRLNFQNLYQQSGYSSEDQKELFTKTDDLIEEAYQKVRGMAHAKNAGVIGNEGLVTAVQNIAKKVAIPNKLKVEVIPFGMENRLENKLEVTLFRMIQEILTNAIKHAQASQITISLTQDSDSINIIIEDNGKGFNVKALNKNEGMGLHNIEKKVEQLNGTFNIDSFEGKGTTIIIDIPL
ncbi:sensor histidine kinase [Flavobacterium sedimenticola]|uniref:Oxygen sensor histidine kinase NreB n=1 Tax=Flavobacterium sedimenticola TaxID=3043286 RepID=A0ABT6XT78_9FLAO|nr:sensor histidine kinase [Flavobacterium sedimenticola]MDI9258310.1 sensor histidine kinase [Flavobacterium sedimenticola]